MAQMLSKKDSSLKVKRAVRRHLRLSRRSSNEEAQAIAQRIVAPLKALEEALDCAALASDQAEDAFDDWHQADQSLDQAVRRLAHRCREWDAGRPGDQSLVRIFAGMTPSEVIYAPRHKQPDIVVKIVVRARELPKEHSAHELLDELEKLSHASREGHRAYVDAVQRAGAESAAADIARLNVIRAYRDSYIDIERASGTVVAESCFPILRRPQKTILEESAMPDDELEDIDTSPSE